MKNERTPNERLEVLIGATDTMSMGWCTIARLRNWPAEMAYQISGRESQTGKKWNIVLDQSLKVARASKGISKVTQREIRKVLAFIGAPEGLIQEESSLEEEEFAGWVVDMA